MSKSDETSDALRFALECLRNEAKSGGGVSSQAKAAAQLILEVEDILRRWSGELAVPEEAPK